MSDVYQPDEGGLMNIESGSSDNNIETEWNLFVLSRFNVP